MWDAEAVTHNPLLRTLDGLWRIWLRPGENRYETYYWPLTYSAFWAQYQIWGLHTLGYHLVNVLLHAGNSVLAALVLERLGVRGAWLAGALFALHPVHAESVAWIVELKDVLSANLYLLAFLAYLRWEERRGHLARSLTPKARNPWYAAALGLFVLSLLAKSAAVSLPAVIAIALWWKRRSQGEAEAGGQTRALGRDMLCLLPFFATAAIMAGACLFLTAGRRQFVPDLSLVERALNSAHAVWFYLGKLFWPVDLMLVYPKWSAGAADSLPYAGALAALLLGLWAARRRIGAGPLAAILCFIVTLAPALGIVPFGFMHYYSFVADRFQYLASLPVLALIAEGLALWYGHDAGAAADGRDARAARSVAENPRRIAALGAALLLLSLGVLTWRQAQLWGGAEDFWYYQYAQNPRAYGVLNNLGMALESKGRMREAMAAYRKSVTEDPANPQGFLNLGAMLADAGRTDDAIQFYRDALRIDPRMPQAHNNLALALKRQGKAAEARKHFEQAVALDPLYANAWTNLGALLQEAGETGKAAHAFQMALRADPANPLAHRNLAAISSM